jgi:tetratricopeptide (TPR) repeat protein
LLKVFEQVCQALAYAHSKRVVHRDLKPHNVMVGAFGEVQVMDWGLAKVLASGGPECPVEEEAASVIRKRHDEGNGSATEEGAVMGTAAYMPPEQARGEVQAIDARSDVFGLGAMLCHILTGLPAFPGPSKEAMRRARAGDLADAFARLDGCGADAELTGLAKRCLAPEQANRPADASVLAAELTAYLESVEARLRQAELDRAKAELKATEERRRRKAQLAAAVALLLLVVGGGGAVWLWQATNASLLPRLEAVRQMQEQARKHPLGEPRLFREAAEAARNVEELARKSAASFRVRRQAAVLAEELDEEAEAAARDRRLLAALLEVHAPREGPKYSRDEKGMLMAMAEPSVDDQFKTAFHEWGLDVDRTPTEEAVALFQNRPAAVVTEVVAALDEWASWRRQQRLVVRSQRPSALAQALDDDPGSKRRELRAMIARGALHREFAISTLAMSLRPVPVPIDTGWGADRKRLRDLVAATDVKTEPVLGLLTLARALHVAGNDVLAETLLRAALRARPQEVVLHSNLVKLLAAQHRWPEVVEIGATLRGIRPELGAILAHALVNAGRVKEGLALFERLTEERKDDPVVHAALGIAFGDQGRDKEAEAAYREALRLKPDLHQAHNNLGVALAKQGKPVEAVASFKNALRLKPDFPEAHDNLGLALAKQGKRAEAVACHREALRLKPDLHQAHNNLGNALDEQGKPAEAVACYREALRLKPDYPLAHNNLGVALAAQGKRVEAVASYREALRLKPDYPKAHNNLGNALVRQGKPGEAVACYREAIRLKPDYPTAHYNLGNALQDQGKLAEAVASYKEAIRLKPDYPEALCNLGNALQAQGKLAAAVASYRKALRLEPDCPEAHNNLGNALQAQGKLAAAVASYRKALRLKPDHASAHNNLGNALQRQGKLDEAVAAFKKAIRLKRDFPEAHYNLGIALQKQKKLGEAVAAFKKAIRLKHDFPLAHHNLGAALHDQGKLAEAVACYREALRLKHDFPDAHNNLGNALVRQGKPGEAVACYREALRLKADLPAAHYNLGNALKAQGKLAAAVASYRKALRLKHDFPLAHHNLGAALHDQGKLAEAVACYREALRLKPDFPAAHCNLGNALVLQGKLAEAEVAFRKAIKIKHDYPEAHYNLGITLGRQGRWTEAETAFRQAIRLRADNADAMCNLGHALQAQGRFREALAWFRKGHALGSQRPGWSRPSGSWVGRCRRLLTLDRLLPRILEAKADPTNASQRLELASLCRHPAKRLHRTATHFAADAFAADPKLANDLHQQHRYQAACSAVLAAAGQAEDARLLPDRVFSSLHRQALAWLRGDLARYAADLKREPRLANAVRERLNHWQKDPDLASVRDDEPLRRLPGDERAAWRSLWDDVAALLKKTQPKERQEPSRRPPRR